jgi:hypothetical protein
MNPSDEYKNAFDSIRISLDFRANEQNESNRQSMKDEEERISM